MRAAIELRAVSQQARPGVVTLRDVSLTVERGELIAIIGGSGSGKTTLLDTMCGLRPPVAGEVIRAEGTCVGYVPQDDIIHLALPLKRTLRYAATLRHVPDPDTAVEDVLRTLELAGRSVVPVGHLSGGERKRASIAAELLARPGLFFLDEPTSGLDPARGTELMRTLRRLCDSGTTVVLTTHNPLDAEVCDKVAVLASGGHLAFFGTLAAARGYFGTDSTVEIYERLAGVGDPARNWSRRYFDSRLTGTAPAVSPSPLASDAREAAGVSQAATGTATLDPGDDVLDFGTGGGYSDAIAARTPARGPGAASVWSEWSAWTLRPVRQWALLTQRNADTLTRSKLTAAMLAGSPLAVLLMFLVLFRPGAFDPAHPSPSATVMIMFWVAFGGFFFGLTYGLLAICTEWGVLRRERFAGLGAATYVLAKVSVLLPLLAVVDLVFLVVLRLLDRLPAAGDYVAVFVTLVLCSAAALGLGLLISAAVAEPSQATIAMPMACFPQVLFVGAILPVPVMAAIGKWISFAMTNRWAFEALGNSLGVVQLWSNGRSSLGRPLLMTYVTTFDRPVVVDWLVLSGFTVAFVAATIAVVLRKTR
ncbi:MAG: transporter ATP-binding protein [Actinomycetia bacterium]|nr:transporter ATP-binding protein [Actinomycetes bacterium]